VETLQDRVLESLESARNYNAWVASLARPFLGTHPIEIGSGRGGNAALWLEAGVPRITVSEMSSAPLAALRSRFAADARVEVAEIDLLQAPEREHTAVVAVNVLEHIDDHVGALRSAQKLLGSGGHVVVFVPAFEFAMSRFDLAIGHMRRYTRRSLRAAMEEAGLDVVKAHYVNAPGLLGWFVGMKLLRMEPKDGLPLRAWDRVVVPVARSVESRRPPPFGQSVLGVGRIRG
jgi:ubiquinone/menaquinone biosynthesis C-methylase UbiE